MTVKELDAYFRSILDLEGFAATDPSLNGLQVDNDGSPIGKIAFAVDASLEAVELAAARGAGLLFVHHGLFWGAPLAIVGAHRARVERLLQRNIALYAAHLPLDQHPELGNNAVLAGRLGLQDPQAFGTYHGRKIGWKGALAEPLDINEAARRVSHMNRPPLAILPFGKKINRTCAVVSGGAAMEALQAIDEGLDLYVTGEAGHTIYHHAQESGLNIVAAGHYATEVWGVNALSERAANDAGLQTEFLDLPTGL
ncbi:MAG: Nif3-like dinuclear metal center hexameric protein [Spirochaetaceae bacterium]|jgi:dinuclear metal center YbgI/SA1388 family protein|nr:Nif3-like dinuclear metal center hexameric protein [Spirochaetaceae bacterium]